LCLCMYQRRQATQRNESSQPADPVMIHDAKDGATNIGLHSSLRAHLAPFFVLFNASTGYAKSTTGCR
jgi:hypothetical protein